MKVRLGDLCRFINGDRGKNYPSQAEISSNGDIPFINAGHIVDGELDFSEMNYISEEKYNQLNSGKIQEDDILYCLRGSLGKKAIIKGVHKGAIASSLVIIRPDVQRINGDYLFFALESPTVQEQMMYANNGSSQPNLSAKSVSDYKFNLPDIRKQLLIVSKLVKVNELIALRKEQLAKLDELVKSRFIELFGDPKYNKSNLVKIGEIGALTSGGTPSRAKPEYFEGDIRWYSAGELNSLYLPDSVEHISERALQQSSAKLFNKGTLMIGMYDTAAFKMGILTEDSSSNQACANLNPKQGYNIVWLYYLFDIMKPIFLQERQGVRQKNLSLSKIKEFEVPFAPFELQERFAAFVEQTDKSKLVIQQSLDKLETLKKSLMQKYFG